MSSKLIFFLEVVMKKIIIILLFVLCINVSAESVVVTLNDCVDGDTAWFNYNGKRNN